MSIVMNLCPHIEKEDINYVIHLFHFKFLSYLFYVLPYFHFFFLMSYMDY